MVARPLQGHSQSSGDPKEECCAVDSCLGGSLGFYSLQAALARLIRFCSRKQATTEAQLLRAIKLFEKAIDAFEAKLAALIRSRERALLSELETEAFLPWRRQALQATAADTLAAARSAGKSLAQELCAAALALKFRLQNAPKRDALYVFMNQRLSRSKTNSRLMHMCRQTQPPAAWACHQIRRLAFSFATFVVSVFCSLSRAASPFCLPATK